MCHGETTNEGFTKKSNCCGALGFHVPGPVTARVVPPMRAPATPETAAVTSPTSAGTPLAKAMASDSGTAMHPTVNPADMSVKSVSAGLVSMRFHSGNNLGMPKSRMKRLLLLGFVTGAAAEVVVVVDVDGATDSSTALTVVVVEALLFAFFFWSSSIAAAVADDVVDVVAVE